MSTKRAVLVLVVALLAGAWVSKAPAQSCTTTITCGWYSFSSGCIPVPPLTAYDGVSDGPFEWEMTVRTPACAPAPYCLSCALASHPIDLATGDTYFTQTDVGIPGLGGGLTLKRTWNSIAFGNGLGIFGPNWTSNFEESIFVGPDHYLHYIRGDGSAWTFGFSTWDTNGNPTYLTAGPANQVATITQYNQTATNQTWGLVLQNGEQRVFDLNSGRLLTISDRNGNTTGLTYDSSFRLITVTDAASRHIFLSYSGSSAYLVSNVTSDFGVSLAYSYDGLGRLIQVTKPDTTTVSFQYNDINPNLITSVLDSSGKVLESHTYNTCAQGLTASRALGVDAVTVAYPLACHLGFLAAP